MNATPFASFDVLQITSHISAFEDGATESEIHVMCYLASMLHVFSGAGPDTWGYNFSATGAGAPFAEDLEAALARLLANGYVHVDGDVYSLAAAGETTLQQLASHSAFVGRAEFLACAANTALAMSLPAATGAVMQEPQLDVATVLLQRRRLLDRSGVAVLAPYFAGLRDLVATDPSTGTHDLFSVAVLWLKYLRRSSEQVIDS